MLNVEKARIELKKLEFCADRSGSTGAAYWALAAFIDDVEKLLKYNSIKQVPALLKEKK